MAPASERGAGLHRRVIEPLMRFAELFNQGRFWDSHEVLEEPWRNHGSEFYHGLILFASAFVHVKRGNRHGIGAQLRKALPHLEPRTPHYLGVDVEGLVSHTHRCLRMLEEQRGEPSGGWEELIPFPTLTLRPEHVLGDEPELRQG